MVYLPRLADQELVKRLEYVGAVVIEGAKAVLPNLRTDLLFA